jgi:hypothetical protein
VKNYEIWDRESGNLLVDRPTEVEALSVVREAIARHGAAYADSLSLIFEDDEDEIHVIAEGPELAELAMSNVHASRP